MVVLLAAYESKTFVFLQVSLISFWLISYKHLLFKVHGKEPFSRNDNNNYNILHLSMKKKKKTINQTNKLLYLLP